MPNSTISQLPAASQLTGAEYVAVDQNSVTKKTTVSNLTDGTVSVGSAIHSAPAKTVPDNADEFGIWNSLTSALSKITYANLKAQFVNFLQNGTGATTRTVQNKLTETVSVWDFMNDAQKADVLAGTALVDTLNAFVNAMASFPNTFDTAAYNMGGIILVPPGRYYLSDTLKIDHNITLTGSGAPSGVNQGISQLLFADNIDGIVTVDYRDSPSNKQGSGVIIRGLSISRKNTGGTVGSGISIKTPTRLYDLLIGSSQVGTYGFREHGILIDTVGGTANANLWEAHSITVGGNGGHGMYCVGGDSNAGLAVSISAIYNGGYGIYDNSFLGNTFIACHTAGNTLGGYHTDPPNTQSVFLGCYTELDQPTSIISGPSVWYGGLNTMQGPGFRADSTGRLTAGSTIATPTLTFGYSQAATSGTGFSFADTNALGGFWAFSKQDGAWGYQWSNLGSVGAPGYFIFYDRGATVAKGYARNISDAPAGNVGAIGISPYFFGNYTEMKYRGLGTAAPTSGEYLQGDIIYNSAPAAGGFIGWVCVTSGNPGVWQTYGPISV